MVQNRKFVPHRNMSAEYIVCINSRSNASFQGTIEHSKSRESQQFRSFEEMLMLIESRREVLVLPRPDLPLRSWKEAEKFKISEEENSSMPKDNLSDFEKAIQKSGGQEFFIRIMSKQHASWHCPATDGRFNRAGANSVTGQKTGNTIKTIMQSMKSEVRNHDKR